MTATNAERAVIEAARKVFSSRYGGVRVDRIAELKNALDRLELEYLALEMDQPSTEERFRSALEIVGANRAQGVYERLWADGVRPPTLHSMTIREALDLAGAGPSCLAAFAAALEHAGFTVPDWARASGHKDPYFAKLASYRETLRQVRDGRP